MTYHDKAAIPQKVYDNLGAFASGYDVRIYDDADCEAMLTSHFPPAVLERFRSLKGAHKADLLRYCYLLKDGGVYMDIKTELVMPLDHIIDHARDHAYYTVLIGIFPDAVYQGIVACPPQHPVIRECLEYIVHLPPWVARWHYRIFITDMHAVIRRRCSGAKRLVAGWMAEPDSPNVYHILPMVSSYSNPAPGSPYRCADGMDRYGLCEFVVAAEEPCHSTHRHPAGTPLFKLRYADFPWAKGRGGGGKGALVQ
jgi:hypothetical protein